MAGHRCFIFPGAEQGADRIVLERRESHHLLNVLRARDGDPVTLLDGRGAVREGRLTARAGGLAEIAVASERRYPMQRPELALAFALPKGRAAERVLRMAAEIGVARLQPLLSDHGEVRLGGGRVEGRIEKWRLTLVEACKQCGLPWLPALAAPLPFAEWLAAADPPCRGELRIVASLEGGSRPLGAGLDPLDPPPAVLVAIGPEGDFSKREYAALRTAGFRPVRLAANVLRVETAAAYVLSVIDQILRGGVEPAPQ